MTVVRKPADAGPRERHGARSALGETLTSEAIPSRTTRFAGEPHCVTGARLAAEEFLCDLGDSVPPASPEHWDDILLVVTELAANAVQYAPGPFALRMRRTFDGVHVTLRDTNPAPPAPRSFNPRTGGGGIGWHLIHALCDQVSVVPDERGKDVHVFLPW